MSSLSSTFIARSLGLPPPPKDFVFSSVCTDSRKIIPGCLFVALKGENFDGHRFIAAAIESGAKGILGETGTIPDSSAQFFPVKDSLEGFRKLAGAWRQEFKIPVALIAGSNGKT